MKINLRLCFPFILLLSLFSFWACESDELTKYKLEEKEPLTYEQLTKEKLPNAPSVIQDFFSPTKASTLNPHIKPELRSRGKELIIEAAATNLFTQNERDNFIPYMVQYVGLPDWQLAIVDESKNSLSIPFIDATNNFTKGYLLGKANEDLSQFKFVLIERRYLDLRLSASENELQKIGLMVAHDFDLFTSPDRGLFDFYEKHKSNLTDLEAESRQCFENYEVCGCIFSCMAFNDDKEIEADTRSCPQCHEYRCYIVTVLFECGGSSDDGSNNNGEEGGSTCLWCGPTGMPAVIAGSGGNSPLNPTFVDEIILLQDDCLFGDDDLDVDSNGGDFLDEETIAFCKAWNRYKEKCLGDD